MRLGAKECGAKCHQKELELLAYDKNIKYIFLYKKIYIRKEEKKYRIYFIIR